MSLFCSVQFSLSVVSDSLQPHELQQARPPCSSPTPGVHSNSRPSSRWCHPAISSSVVRFSSCPQSLQYLVINLCVCVCACTHVCVRVQPLSHVWLFAIPWTVTGQAPLSLAFTRQEYWSGLKFPPPGKLSNSGIEFVPPVSPALAGRSFTTVPPGKPQKVYYTPNDVPT